MGLIDKNYLNKINQSVQNQISNQPCGCECNCRPKFESDSAPGPVPGCNCGLRTNYFVGDWVAGAPGQTTTGIFLQVANGWNCAFEMQFRWVNVSFANVGGVSVQIGTLTTLNPLGNQWQTLILQPGEFFYFVFTGIQETFDQVLNIEARNITCAESYGVVGTWTLLSN